MKRINLKVKAGSETFYLIVSEEELDNFLTDIDLGFEFARITNTFGEKTQIRANEILSFSYIECHEMSTNLKKIKDIDSASNKLRAKSVL